jgi:hypothetical protein
MAPFFCAEQFPHLVHVEATRRGDDEHSHLVAGLDHHDLGHVLARLVRRGGYFRHGIGRDVPPNLKRHVVLTQVSFHPLFAVHSAHSFPADRFGQLQPTEAVVFKQLCAPGGSRAASR